MQKIALTKIIREEVLRAIVFASVLFAILFAGFGTLAYAADGGLFGEILNKIMVKTWNDPSNDGTVKNCEKLWGKSPSEYVQVPSGGFTCAGANTCMYKIDATGTPECR
jgi:hypothetical protein